MITIFEHNRLFLDVITFTLRGCGFGVQQALSWRTEYIHSTGILCNCGTESHAAWSWDDFEKLLPLFEHRYQGPVLLYSFTPKSGMDDDLADLVDPRIFFSKIPLDLNEIISILSGSPIPADADAHAREHFCRNIRRYFPARRLSTALQHLKEWYSEEKIADILHEVRNYSSKGSLTALEHQLQHRAPWIHELKSCFLTPVPLPLKEVPKQLNVLIVDDRETWHEKIRWILNEVSGGLWRIDSVYHKEQALDRVRTYLESTDRFTPIDIILLDLNFESDPEAGLMILEDIRHLTKNIPVIILTVQTGTSLRIIECIQKGANFYVDKADLENLPAYILKTLETATLPKIDNRCLTLELTPEEEYLLRHVFRKNSTVIVEKNIGSSGGTKKIFKVRRYSEDKSHFEQFPVIVKMGPADRLSKEYRNYRRFIAPYMPFHAAGIERCLCCGDLAVLAYIKIGGANDALDLNRSVSLHDGLRLLDQGRSLTIASSLKRFFNEDIGPAWYDKAVVPHGAGMRVHDPYARKMPIVLELSPGHIMEEVFKPTGVNDLSGIVTGRVVTLTGRIVAEKGKTFIRAFHSDLKIHLTKELACSVADYENRTATIIGKVTDTLTEMLMREWREAVMADPMNSPLQKAAFQKIEDKEMNPIHHIWEILLNPLSGNLSLIHGDLHLENLFFDFDRDLGWLIDYGSSGHGHVCFDFIRLEVDIRTRFLSGILNEMGGTLNDMLIFERCLPPFHQPLIIKDVHLRSRLTAAGGVLSAIRESAQKYFLDPESWNEYFQGLFCYALNTFKFPMERRRYFPYSRYLPMVCAYGAYHYMRTGMATGIKAVVFDVWNTLLEGNGNPLLADLKDMLSTSAALDLKEKLLTQDLSRKECAAMICEYVPDFDPARLSETSNHNRQAFALKPGAEELVRNLHQCGLKLGLLSNDWAWEHSAVVATLKKANLWGYFSTTVFSFREGWVKPEKQLFQTVLQRLNVKPCEAYMVGDSHANDILPAEALGMHVFQITRQRTLSDFWEDMAWEAGFGKNRDKKS